MKSDQFCNIWVCKIFNVVPCKKQITIMTMYFLEFQWWLSIYFYIIKHVHTHVSIVRLFRFSVFLFFYHSHISVANCLRHTHTCTRTHTHICTHEWWAMCRICMQDKCARLWVNTRLEVTVSECARVCGGATWGWSICPPGAPPWSSPAAPRCGSPDWRRRDARRASISPSRMSIPWRRRSWSFPRCRPKPPDNS